MLDPKTLKVDDQLEIGGQVRYYCGQDTYGCHKLSEKKGGCIFDRFTSVSAFWETAELKKPELPNLTILGLGLCRASDGSDRYFNIGGEPMSSSELLLRLNNGKYLLEQAGVKSE